MVMVYGWTLKLVGLRKVRPRMVDTVSSDTGRVASKTLALCRASTALRNAAAAAAVLADDSSTSSSSSRGLVLVLKAAGCRGRGRLERACNGADDGDKAGERRRVLLLLSTKKRWQDLHDNEDDKADVMLLLLGPVCVCMVLWWCTVSTRTRRRRKGGEVLHYY